MNKIFLTLVISSVTALSYAQGGYDAGNLIQHDLIGTARYVGMGGALNALGADLSTMNSNPAAIGLYRKADINVTGSVMISGDNAELTGSSKSRTSIDQAGVAYAFAVDDSGEGLQFVNFGLSYRKNHNFFGNNNVNVGGLSNKYSQTIQLADLANDAYREDYFYGLAYMSAPFYDNDGYLVSDQGKDVDCSVLVHEPDNTHIPYYGVAAEDARYYRNTYGKTSEIDLDLAFNVSDRFYYGVSIGIHNVNYNRNSFYAELAQFVHSDDGSDHYYDFSNSYITTGTGFDAKFGVICRPFSDSPFRVGLSFATPIWYKLTDANSSVLFVDEQYISSFNSDDYDYHLTTPWRLNVSLGHTFGSKLAIGAEYELCDYSKAKYADTNNKELYVYNDDKTEHNGDVKSVLKAQHTVKVGAEFIPVDNFSVRVGYNYVSSAYKNNKRNWRYYDSCITDTDYTNWGGINRITCGLGYRWGGGYIDLAYQYQMQKGDFYAFSNSGVKDGQMVHTTNYAKDNELAPSTIKNNRSQIMATLGFRF